jgi:hypothetical protein
LGVFITPGYNPRQLVIDHTHSDVAVNSQWIPSIKNNKKPEKKKKEKKGKITNKNKKNGMCNHIWIRTASIDTQVFLCVFFLWTAVYSVT